MASVFVAANLHLSMELLTLGLLIVAGIQAFLFVRQLELMNETLRDAKVASNAAKDSADAARDGVRLAGQTARQQLRAYLMIQSVTPSKNPANVPAWPMVAAYHITTKNFGQTPAYDARITCLMGIGHAVEKNTLFDVDNPLSLPPPSSTIIPPGAAFSSYTVLPLLDGETVDGLREGTMAFYIHGQLTYRDIFDEVHRTDFRFVREPQSHAMGVCEEGNSAT